VKRTLTAIVLIFMPCCAQAQTNEKDQKWKKIIDYAFTQHPKMFRGCYPKEGYCNVTLQYYSSKDHNFVELEIQTNFNDEWVNRYICKTNLTEDIKHCINFDTGERDVAVKNAHTGKFELIEENNEQAVE
jgi:hypothetical protein